MRKYIHAKTQDKQIRSVKTALKGKEAKLKSSVLEQRVYKTPTKIHASGKKRPKSSVNSLGVSKYTNPGDRPQLNNIGYVDRNLIFAKLSGDNPAMRKALGFSSQGKKKTESQLMKKLNKPLALQ